MTSSLSNTGMLDGKKILITGMLSNRSIAYGIAKSCAQQGAELAFTYQSLKDPVSQEERFQSRVTALAKELGFSIVLPCDLTQDDSISNAFLELGSTWDQIDGCVHSVAFAPRSAISGDFLAGIDKEAFKITQETSSYSFLALAKAAQPMMKSGGALLTLSYLGGQKVVPNYNMMGLAKASLEASVWYLANSLGPLGIRVNALSPGPIKTLAASGILGFNKILDHVAAYAPLRRNTTLEDVGSAAAFLLSDFASGITGEITYVDGGFNKVVSGL